MDEMWTRFQRSLSKRQMGAKYRHMQLNLHRKRGRIQRRVLLPGVERGDDPCEGSASASFLNEGESPLSVHTVAAVLARRNRRDLMAPSRTALSDKWLLFPTGVFLPALTVAPADFSGADAAFCDILLSRAHSNIIFHVQAAL